MTLLDSMGTLAELSISVVGFTGVVIALRSRAPQPLRTAVMSMLFGFGLSGVIWAMLPAMLLGSGLDEAFVWRLLSSAFALTMIVLVAIRRIQARKAAASWAQIGLTVPVLSLCQLGVLTSNVYFASPALYQVALLSNLSIGLVLFWILIEPGGRPLGGDTKGAP